MFKYLIDSKTDMPASIPLQKKKKKGGNTLNIYKGSPSDRITLATSCKQNIFWQKTFK